MIRPENNRAAAETADLFDSVTETLGRMAGIRGAVAALTATASAEHGRITVTVNASGSIIETVYADELRGVSFGQIARATVKAAQAAAAEVETEKARLLAPLTTRANSLPQITDLFPDLAAFRAQMPQPLRAPLTAPSTNAEQPDDRHRILDR